MGQQTFVAVAEQLTFEVGGDLKVPAAASIGISGKGTMKRELYIDDDVTVQIIDADGQVVASFAGAVVDVGFKKHPSTETTLAYVERVHKVKLGEQSE